MEYLGKDIHNHISKLIVCNVSVYILKYQDVDDIPRTYFEESFPKRLAESERFIFKADELRCLGVAVLLREILGLSETDVHTEEYGKPYTDSRQESFSISHSGDYVVLALSEKNVGVDIEKMDTKYCEIARTVYTDREIQWFKEDDATIAQRFMRIWTLKECVSKITGLGLNTEYKGFTVMPLIEDGYMQYEGHNIIGETSYELDGYCLSVCVVK